MNVDKISAGKNAPENVNVIIEVPMNADPVKYEMDKDSGVILVDGLLLPRCITHAITAFLILYLMVILVMFWWLVIIRCSRCSYRRKACRGFDYGRRKRYG